MVQRPFVLALTATLLSALASGCGGRIEDERPDVGDAPSPVAVYELAAARTGETCPRVASGKSEDIVRPQGATEAVDVVAVTYESECTGLGGDYILAASVEVSEARYFLGAHGCLDWRSDVRAPFGVIRHRPMATKRRIPPGVCVGSETNQARGIEVANDALGLALFSTRVEAERFARYLR